MNVKKIDNDGLLLCEIQAETFEKSIDKMNSMSKKCLGEEAFNKNKCAFNNWLALINYFYNDNEFSKSARERLSDCLQFSIINYDKKDKFGNYKPTIGESYSRLSSELINMDDIANDLSTEEEANELLTEKVKELLLKKEQ